MKKSLKKSFCRISLVLLSLLFTNISFAKAKSKNLILIIGDGMGPQQISLLYSFAEFTKTGVVSPDSFAFGKIADNGTVAYSATNPELYAVTDSACSATHLATGYKSLPGAIGVDSEGYSRETILEKAKKAGKATGLVSDTRITHATPASFAAHVASRDEETEIAEQMLKTEPDLMLSAGVGYFLSEDKLKDYTKQSIDYKARRKDGKDLLQQAKKQNYELAFNIQELKATKSKKVLGLFADKGMPDGTWYKENKNKKDRTMPSLKEMAMIAMDKLEKDENGYFLMIEAGQIDWAGHRNDAGTMLHQMIEANEMLNAVYDRVAKDKDTLMVVTADHETGAFGLAYNMSRPHKEVKGLKGPAWKDGYSAALDYLTYDALDKMYEQKLSLNELLEKYEDNKSGKKDIKLLRKLIKENTAYEITKDQAKYILSNAQHPYALGNKKYKKFPGLKGPISFYPSAGNTRIAMLSQIIGPMQGVTWGTGGHTATPVGVFSFSKNGSHKNFGGFLHHSELGKKLQEVLGL
ncbi:MAG: alkaline phosphatase [Bdellovibrionota bacterium]|nr:alkaline phosphatase [Bdellovibrionota bacterium]